MTTLLEPTDITEIAPAPETTSGARAGRWLGFGAVVAASVLNILDSTLVNVAGPSIRQDLSMSTSTLEWIAAAYTLALAVGLMVGARLGDALGRKRLFVSGLVGFIATSLLCSAAWNADVLVTGRALQGLAGALMLPQCLALLRAIFPGEDFAKAMGAMGPVIGMATVLGPVTAGLLIKLDLFGTDWRSLFWINVPIGLFALVAGIKALPDGAPVQHGLRLDIGGGLLLAAASFMLVFPLVEGRTLDWPAWVFAVLVGSVPVFAAFGLQQRARRRAGRDPLVETSVLGKRSYVSGVLFVLVFFGTIIGFSLSVGLFLQIGLGWSATRAALYLAAMALGTFVGAGVGAWAATNLGRPILHIGLTIMAAATVLLHHSLHGASTVGLAQLAPGLGVFGLGMGMIFVPLFSIVMGEIDEREVGSAAGLLTSMEQLGSSLGVAVIGTVFFGALRLEQGGLADGRQLVAVEHALVGVLIAIAAAWLLGWLLPRRARTDAH